MMQRIVPFVDHEIGYRLLQKLISSAVENDFEIPAVVTTLDNGAAWWPSVDEICLKENIPLYIYEETDITDFVELQSDWFLLLSWRHIIPADLIRMPKKSVLNLHYSLLPEFRGVYPVNWSIIEGREETGFTFHFVNEKIDGGRVFMQVKVPIRLSDTARTLQLRIDNAVCDCFDEFIENLIKLNYKDFADNECKNSKIATKYYPMSKFKEACALDLNTTYLGSEILNLLRGLTFLPDSKNAYFLDTSSGKKIYVNIELREE